MRGKLAGGGADCAGAGAVDHQQQSVLQQLHAKGGPPLKATLPMSSVLRGPIASGALLACGSGGGVFGALSPPPPLAALTGAQSGGATGAALLLRHISPPEFAVCGHRSPGWQSYTG